ncbi:MAG TPA: hypothetical protein VGL02_14070 [Streptomyces sp.]
MTVTPGSRPRRWSTLLAVIALAAPVVATTATAPAALAQDGSTHAGSTHAGRVQQGRAHHARTRKVHVSRAFFGLHDGSGRAYGHVRFGSLRLWDAGVTWQDVETAPGVYDWDRLDSLVAAAQAHHVEVTLVLAMTPSFYSAEPTSAPADLDDYARYVRAVMTRYRSFDGERGIAAYQVWNEGNVSAFWTGTPQQLAQLTAVVARVRRQVDPGAEVVAPSFAIRLPYQRRWLSSYERQRVRGYHVWRYVDANAISIYPKATYGDRTGGPEDAMALVGRIRHRLAHAGVPRHQKLWATEVNYGVAGGGPGVTPATPISQRRQVANVLRTYLLGAADGLARVFWYRYDWRTVAGGGTLGNTLLTVPGEWDRVTPAGRAVGTARAWLRGRLVGTHGRRPCAAGRHGTYRCTVRYRGGVRTIYWNPHRRVRVHLPASARALSVAGRVLGRSVSRRAAATVRVGFQPVMVTRAR